MRKSLLYIFLGAVWVAANLTPLLLIWLLWPRLGPAKVPTGDSASALATDFWLALIFPLQHSIWTQTPVKKRLFGFFGLHFERPMYALSSGIALVLMVGFWRTTNAAIWQPPSWSLWPLRVAFLIPIALQMYSTTLVGAQFLSGIAHLKTYMKNKPLREPEFKERGLYRWVRHPIAMSQLIMIWIAGTMYADRLLLACMWTLWIVTATSLEDRRLGRQFGTLYEDYRRRAGFLWPRLGAPAKRAM